MTATITLNPDVYDAAADYLEREGLTKGAFCEGKRRCALGALAEGLVIVKGLGIEAWTPTGARWYDLAPELQDSFDEHEQYMVETIFPDVPFQSITEWNDKPSRRRADVVKAFRKTANKLREEQSA